MQIFHIVKFHSIGRLYVASMQILDQQCDPLPSNHIFYCRKKPANWSHAAKSGSEDITATQCEAYELTKLGHEYQDPLGYQNPEHEIPVTQCSAYALTSKPGE